MRCRIGQLPRRIPGPPNTVRPQGVRSAVAMKLEAMHLHRFRPGTRKPQQPQQPHTRGDLYVLIAGRAGLVTDRTDRADRCVERRPCRPDDVPSGAAGAPHRLAGNSPQFMTWVVFCGPDGGAAAPSARAL